MIKMRPYVPSNRIAIRDSIGDDDLSDDVDDEVFIKDARSAKNSEENGLKRPLMAPRRKNGRLHSTMPIMKKHRRCWRWCEPFCYGLAALTILIALISLAALILTLFPVPLQRIKVWLKQNPNAQLQGVDYVVNVAGAATYGGVSFESELVPCTQISVQKVWSQIFPRMNSESPLRKADLNGDGVKDIIFGYGVDDNIQYEGLPLPKCKSAQQQGSEVPCEGGVIALNGLNGKVLWQTWSIANVFSLICTLDIDKDGYPDCVAAGRLGLIFAINGRNGNSIWEFREIEVETNSPIVMDLYTINVVRDLDGDEVMDILAAHLEEREESKTSHIKVISGKTGKVIRTIPTPFKEEIFVPLQVVTKADGTELLLIITGGQNTAGGIYSLRLLSLMQYKSEKQFTPLFQRNHSGFMAPAVLADINNDQVVDIIVSSFNATVYAFDGRNFNQLWNYTFPASESVSAIVPGHFNNDSITDFMVKYNTGPGFPVYYYSQTTVLDGKTGKPLLSNMLTDSGGSSSLLGGISISQTFGGDFYLHWQMQCRDRYDAKDAYEFIPDSDIILQARADTCRLRYNTSTVVKLYAIARHIKPQSAVIFSTDDLEVQLNRTQRIQSPRMESKSPLKHPKMLKKLLANRPTFLKKLPAVENTADDSYKIEKAKLYHQNHYKANPLRNPLFEQEVLQEILPNNDMNLESNPYLAEMGLNNETPLKELKDYETRVPAEYLDYTENEVPQIVTQNEGPIHLRTKYPLNRDVRSDFYYNHTAATAAAPTAQNLSKSNKEEALNLWDLEIEKEAQDNLRQLHKYDYSIVNNKIEENKKQKKRQRRRLRRSAPATQPPTPTILSSSSSSSSAPQKITTAAAEANEDEQYFLPAISSTGVLLKSLDNATSSLDYVFILNIRESETYPPLFRQQDLDCVEEKISAFKSYRKENLRAYRKQFLKECLNQRLVNLEPEMPRYESQLIVTRITITCTCRQLLKGEVCSELEDIQKQRWTEYMGNDANGFYPN